MQPTAPPPAQLTLTQALKALAAWLRTAVTRPVNRCSACEAIHPDGVTCSCDNQPRM